MTFPCILHWNNHHFVVCYNVKGKGEKRKFYIDDPAIGKIIYSQKEMYKYWVSGKLEGEYIGLAIQIEPAVDFYKKDDENEKSAGFYDW